MLLNDELIYIMWLVLYLCVKVIVIVVIILLMMLIVEVSLLVDVNWLFKWCNIFLKFVVVKFLGIGGLVFL